MRVCLAFLAAPLLCLAQSNPVLRSPDGRIEVTFAAAPQLTWQVRFNSKPVLQPSLLGLEIQGQRVLGDALAIQAATPSQADETYSMPHGKSNPIRNHHNRLLLSLAEPAPPHRQLEIEARAWNDAIAFRYRVPAQPALRELRITQERTRFLLARDGDVYPLVLPSYRTSYETNYVNLPLSSVPPEWLIALPLLAHLPGVAWVAITEAHIENYAGMYLTRTGAARNLEARLAPRADSPALAVSCQTPCVSPWRVLMLADHPGRLVESNVVVNLNPPSRIADTSWIRPGRAVWPWWSGDFAEIPNPGMNTATNKHYIDFAAENGFEYLLVDEGWTFGGRTPQADLTRSIDAVDIPEIVRYARERKVAVWLWAHWTLVDRQMEQAFAQFEKWGVAGVKIDFMDRDDQWMVDFYHRTLQAAAAHRLMVDFHGAYKPDGIRRTWPNLMTREGVLGLEYIKWSARATPEHNVLLPFTRMLAGPMDYTPGGFRSVPREQFEPRFREPVVLGTRAHQLALFVVFESAFQCLADHPGAYRNQPGLDFLRAVPAAWDETRVLDAAVGQYVVIARRRGQDWFVGAITDWTPRSLDVPLAFLGDSRYEAQLWTDAPEAAADPNRLEQRRQTVTRATTLTLKLATGGGAAVKIAPAR